MDLMQENPIEIQEKKSGKFKKWLILIAVLIVLLIIAAVGVWMYSNKLTTELFKVSIDGVSNQSASASSSIFIIENGEVYTSISEITELVGYKYYPGGYKEYTEDSTKCYATNSKELVVFASGSKEIRKYPLLDKNSESQVFEIDQEVITKGNKLYISQAGLQRAFNLKITYNKGNNAVSIATLPYLTTTYEKRIKTASLEKSEFEDSIVFNNEKALLDDLVIIKDDETELYGVASLSEALNGSSQLIISARYSKIEYIEGSEDFIISTEDNKFGIIGSDGITKVGPNYDDIQKIDNDIGLYLVTSNNKQGVINKNGKMIIYQDYDQIGLELNNYSDSNVTNRYLLYGTSIPIKLNNKWGLKSTTGETILPVEYDGIGCSEISNVGVKNTNGIVLIPEIKGIVVEKDTVEGRNTIKNYGIVSSTGSPMINTICDSAYATTVENTTTYYINVQNQAIDIVNYWYEQKSKETNSKNNDQTDAQPVADNQIATETQQNDGTQTVEAQPSTTQQNNGTQPAATQQDDGTQPTSTQPTENNQGTTQEQGTTNQTQQQN